MPGDPAQPPGKSGLGTLLSHVGRPGPRVHGFVNPPVMRGSTVLYPSMAERKAAMSKRFEQALVYGTMGSPTHHALEDAVAAIEGGSRCQIVGTGLAAVTTALLAYLKAGDHCLVPDSCYGPTRTFCDHMLSRMGIETTYYRPEIDEPGMREMIRSNTRVIYVESPGSHTF
jgi:cystathionine beta-lyase